MAQLLVIEDDPVVQDTLYELLTMEGHEVETASDGLAGLHAVVRSRPDLVLCDLMMPHLDGFDVLRRIRAHPQVGNTPFVLLTARATEESRDEGLRLGADDYITKPFSVKDVLATVERRLKRRDADRHGQLR